MHSLEIKYPEEIILEITNICNLQCRFCHFHGEDAEIRRKLGFMAAEIWEKLLDEIETWDRPCTLLTHGAGEPLLYPHLESLLKRAKEIPKLCVGFMTNGMLLTPDVSEMIVSLKIDSIALSVDGVIPKTHDYFRKNAELKLIESNIEYLIAQKEKMSSPFPSLVFNMVGYPDILEQENDYVKKWLPYAYSVMISKFRPVGSRKLWDSDKYLYESIQTPHCSNPLISQSQLSFRACPLLYRQAVIGIDGTIGLCCEDINLDVPVGNIVNNDLLSIYNNNKTLQHYRNMHEKNDIRDLKLCSDCHVWGAHTCLEKYQIQIDNINAVCEIFASGKVYRKN